MKKQKLFSLMLTLTMIATLFVGMTGTASATGGKFVGKKFVFVSVTAGGETYTATDFGEEFFTLEFENESSVKIVDYGILSGGTLTRTYTETENGVSFPLSEEGEISELTLSDSSSGKNLEGELVGFECYLVLNCPDFTDDSGNTPTHSHRTNGNPVTIRTIKTGEGIHGTYKVDKPFIVNGEDVKIIATPDEGYEIDKIYVDGKEVGSLELKNVTEDTKVEVTFKKIGEKIDTPKDEPKEEQQTEVQKIQKQVSKAQFIARSKVSTLKNGKKAIKVIWHDGKNVGVKFDGYEVYRSTDRYTGYGDKPIFKTKNKYYYNTLIEKGTKYYYKVRAYKIVDGKKIYTDYSLKAWREI